MYEKWQVYQYTSVFNSMQFGMRNSSSLAVLSYITVTVYKYTLYLINANINLFSRTLNTPILGEKFVDES